MKQDGSIHSLSVSGVKRSDTGKYSCVITNPHGAKEDSSDLKVRCKPEIKQSLKDVEAKEGDKDVAFVLKADGYPEPKIKWFIDEIEITEERKEFTKSHDPDTGTYSLTLKEIRSDLSGKYSVQLSNELGSVKSSAVLSVQCELTFYKIRIFDWNVIALQIRRNWKRRSKIRALKKVRTRRSKSNAAACPSRRPNGSRTEWKSRPTPASKSRRRPALIR